MSAHMPNEKPFKLTRIFHCNRILAVSLQNAMSFTNPSLYLNTSWIHFVDIIIYFLTIFIFTSFIPFLHGVSFFRLEREPFEKFSSSLCIPSECPRDWRTDHAQLEGLVSEIFGCRRWRTASEKRDSLNQDRRCLQRRHPCDLQRSCH